MDISDPSPHSSPTHRPSPPIALDFHNDETKLPAPSLPRWTFPLYFPFSFATTACQPIRSATRVPRAYLSKVLQALVRGGVVQSQRGLGGGMTLVNSPQKLTILAVDNAVEPIERIRTCPLGLAAHGVHLCPLHRWLDNAMASDEEAFAATTLAELLALLRVVVGQRRM